MDECYNQFMVSTKDKAYFARLAEQNLKLREAPPTTLQESIAALDRVASTLGVLAQSKVSDGDGDLQSHLSYLKRLRRLDPNYRSTRT